MKTIINLILATTLLTSTLVFAVDDPNLPPQSQAEVVQETLAEPTIVSRIVSTTTSIAQSIGEFITEKAVPVLVSAARKTGILIKDVFVSLKEKISEMNSSGPQEEVDIVETNPRLQLPQEPQMIVPEQKQEPVAKLPAIELKKEDSHQQKQENLLAIMNSCLEKTAFKAIESCIEEMLRYGNEHRLHYNQELYNAVYMKSYELKKIQEREEAKRAHEEKQKKLWDSLSIKQSPRQEQLENLIYGQSVVSTQHSGISISVVEKMNNEIYAVTISNKGSPRINPQGRGDSEYHAQNPARTYNFDMDGYARSSLAIGIVDDVAISTNMSADLMNTEIHILPRKYLFRISKVGNEFKVILPNGESLLFDEETKEISSGVIEEMPMDRHPSRHNRFNPRFNYTGKGIAIFTDQRGGDPKVTNTWGKNDHLLKSKVVGVSVVYPSKYPSPCKFSQNKLWKFEEKYDNLPFPQKYNYKTEEELYRIIEKECKWDLREIREWFNS